MSTATSSSGCAYSTSWINSGANVGTDVSYVPTADRHGASTNTGFAASLGFPSQVASGSGWRIDASTVKSAAIDAADSMSLRVRNGVGGLSNVVVFAIGLDNFGFGTEGQTFLKRVANDPLANNHDSSKPAGLFVPAQSSSDLGTAFARVAAEILRISK